MNFSIKCHPICVFTHQKSIFLQNAQKNTFFENVVLTEKCLESCFSSEFGRNFLVFNFITHFLEFRRNCEIFYKTNFRKCSAFYIWEFFISLVLSDHFLAPNERWALSGEKAPFSTYPNVPEMNEIGNKSCRRTTWCSLRRSSLRGSALPGPASCSRCSCFSTSASGSTRPNKQSSNQSFKTSSNEKYLLVSIHFI